MAHAVTSNSETRSSLMTAFETFWHAPAVNWKATQLSSALQLAAHAAPSLAEPSTDSGEEGWSSSTSTPVAVARAPMATSKPSYLVGILSSDSW